MNEEINWEKKRCHIGNKKGRDDKWSEKTSQRRWSYELRQKY